MKHIAIATSLILLTCAAGAAAQAPSATPQPVPSPSHVYVVNPPQSSFFPSDQETGVWQGCGPARDEGLLVDFNREHPRSRIVQVFIDASIPCKAAGAHTFVIVYQEQAQVYRRRVRYPMGR